MSAEPVLSQVKGDALATDPAPDSREQLRRFVRNLVFLIAAGVALSWWLLEFTDFFPAVGGFFGLAGIFAWVAFLGNLVTAERKKQLQQEVERRFLLSTTTTAATILVLILFGCWVVLHGALIVVAPGDGIKRVLELRDGTKTLRTIEVAPGQTVKVPVFTRQRHRPLIVKTAGLPELAVAVPSAGRTKIVVPQSFQAQPVVFALGLTGDDASSLGETPSLRAQIRRNGGPWQEYGRIAAGAYSGESLWVGASADTELPPSLRERQKLARVPAAIGADKPLRTGDAVRLCVLNSEGGEIAFGQIVVLDDRQRPFPQELQLQPKTDEQTRCTP